MDLWKNTMLFSLGGAGYMGLEVLFRGRSHGSMFLAGGLCFLLLGALRRSPLPLPVRGALGAGMVTAVELGVGLAVNRSYQVWDYRMMPLQYRGQICLPFSLLWYPVSIFGMLAYGFLEDYVGKPRQKG